MKPVHVLIADQSYLTTKGLISLLQEQYRIDSVSIEQDHSHISKRFEDETFSFLFINSSSLENVEDLIKLKEDFPTIIFVELYVGGRNKLLSEVAEFSVQLDGNQQEITASLDEIFEDHSIEEDKGSELSERERDVLKLVAGGLANKEIADKLFISTHTVISHRKNITMKLGIKSVSGLTVYALFNKLIPMETLR